MLDGFLAWLQNWDAVISGLGSLVLTTGLVVLYWKQHGLLRQELNRDVRQQHTETLRKRIQAWHGDLDEIGNPGGDLFPDGTNLPTIKTASVEPAPARLSIGQESEFRVVPKSIEGDRYLQDLLTNHAPELNDLKETIEDQYKEFDALREEFVEEYPRGRTIETDDYTVEPMDRFPKWAFERTVRLHRDYYETSKEREGEIAENRLRGTNSGDGERAVMWYSPIPPEGGPSTYKAIFESGDLDDHREYEDEIIDQLVDIHQEAIDDIGEDGIYMKAIKVAEILDEMEESVEELRGKLVEYVGHPLYKGDCPYLDEASVGGSGILSR